MKWFLVFYFQTKMFTKVRSYDNYIPANMMLSMLEQEGIKAYLQDEHTVTIDPLISNAIGGIKLVIKKEDEIIAKLLLETYESEYMKAATCPKCRAHDFSYITKPGATNYLTAIFTWIFSSYAVAPDYVYQCGKCGYESERLPDNFHEESINQN